MDRASHVRRRAIDGLDSILGRVGGLTDCLAKKDYLIQLQKNRPEHSSQEESSRRQAAEELIRVIRGSYSG